MDDQILQQYIGHLKLLRDSNPDAFRAELIELNRLLDEFNKDIEVLLNEIK